MEGVRIISLTAFDLYGARNPNELVGLIKFNDLNCCDGE